MFKAVEAMGAKLATKEKNDDLLHSDNYVGQKKIDGFRISVEKRDGKVRIFGRGSGKYNSRTEYTDLLPHLVQAFEHGNTVVGGRSDTLFDDTILDGEIAFLDENGEADYNKTSNVMGSLPERAISLQRDRGYLTFMLFDVLEYGGTDFIFEQATYMIRHKVAAIVAEKYGWFPNIRLLDNYYGYADKKKLLDDELMAGREGIMLKNLDSIYKPGKKTVNTWYKIKAQFDADVIIIGYEDPKEFTQVMKNGKKQVDELGQPILTKNRFFVNGWIGSLIIGQYVNENMLSKRQMKYVAEGASYHDINGVRHYLVPVGHVSSGLAESVLSAISIAKQQYIGKILEIRYFKRTDDSYYLPRFKRFRDEKPCEECIWEELDS